MGRFVQFQASLSTLSCLMPVAPVVCCVNGTFGPIPGYRSASSRTRAGSNTDNYRLSFWRSGESPTPREFCLKKDGLKYVERVALTEMQRQVRSTKIKKKVRD
ncbi:hypothetical protein GKIL_0533 [Gloeobacter kilaueensis JS1]|uniref:Uncharacterized protein n=1 Tax=Gloeobacter kilaueensis (strain ATCC BAA-2537 / CCAP 1431/1 / ULC 316 / JS1) TaxID=1183438 RepID=U5QGM0_GLOK1|nr:hypothetical protein GKIL_0533 [Gloeobacter kilaueensis JS1]